MLADGCGEPIPANLPVPAGYLAVRCLRCHRRLFVHQPVWLDLPARVALMAEHHGWLCPNPTPHAAALRAAQPPIRRPWE